LLRILNVSSPVVAALYYVLFWTFCGWTPGKLLLGLRVVAPSGAPPSLARSLARLVGYGISALPFYLGFLWILVDPERRAWHDRIAQTRVIRLQESAPMRARSETSVAHTPSWPGPPGDTLLPRYR
jgi:uncharacterized RDD family membrane protein YckC